MNQHKICVLTKYWNEWELRAVIFLSLLLQFFLSVTGSRRKYTASIWLGRFVWLAYVSADSFAALSLGILARSQGRSESNRTTSHASFIPAFWAPMLLVHLGRPDTITAYAVEDNELWLRHLALVLIQLCCAYVASLSSWGSKDPLIYVAIPIFVSGILKCGETVWALWLASSGKFKDSVNEVRKNLLQKIDDRIPTDDMVAMSSERFDREVFQFENILPVAKYLHEAYFLFQTLKLLFADYLVTIPTHMSSYQILKRCKSATEAFKLIEVEMGFMFDILFTKVMTSVCSRPRFILRFINFLSSASALLAFSLMTSRNFHAYSKRDIVISYLLLVGAVVLDIYSAILMLFSDWAMLWLSKQRKPLAVSTYRVISSSRMQSFFSNNKGWKASMAQYESLSFGGAVYAQIQQSYSSGKIQSWEVVDDDLKRLIFNHLLAKRSRYDTSQMHVNDLKIITEQRGDQVLKEKRCIGKIGWSVSGDDFHESFLLWHIATTISFSKDSSVSVHRKMSRSLARYMMYLRKELPFMLPKELGEEKYKLTEGSVLSDAYKLSDILLNPLQTDEGQTLTAEDKWEMISEVWVEMLCYAASHCEWQEHAKALAYGGELLTFVAVLMAHLGLHQQCRCHPKTDQERTLQGGIVDIQETAEGIVDIQGTAEDNGETN